MQWLETASLTEGKFRKDVIDRVAVLPLAEAAAAAATLEQAGFISPRLGGDYRFSHDYIRESVRARLSKERMSSLYGQFGKVYETLAAMDPEFLFHAAEAYQKSSDLAKAIELNYMAARYAADKVAFDIAVVYFTATNLMATQSVKVGVPPGMDVPQMQVEFSDVLVLTNRQVQALKMLEKLLAGKAALGQRMHSRSSVESGRSTTMPAASTLRSSTSRRPLLNWVSGSPAWGFRCFWRCCMKSLNRAFIR